MRTVIAAAVLALVSSCSKDTSPRIADGDAGQLLTRRLWLDEEPRSNEQRFHVLVFDRDRSGIYQDRTLWKGEFELFRYKAKDGGLVLELPGSKRTVKTGYRLERVKRGQADVRLTLDHAADGPSVYWGYKFDGNAADVEAWLATHAEPAR